MHSVKWDKTGVVLENKPNSKVMLKVNGSRRVTMRNRRFVRSMETTLRTTTRPAPARRRPATPPTTRQELPRGSLPSCPRVDVDNVDEVPAEVCEGVCDDRFEEVHDTEDVHHEVDVRQDDDATKVCDDAQAKGRADCDQEGLFGPSPRLRSMMKVQQDPEDRPSPIQGTAQTTTTSTV